RQDAQAQLRPPERRGGRARAERLRRRGRVDPGPPGDRRGRRGRGGPGADRAAGPERRPVHRRRPALPKKPSPARPRPATRSWREVAYYVSQVPLDAAGFGRAVRAHWGIENRDHHVRDRVLREDDSRIRRRPGVFARLRSFALNILRADGVGNVSEAVYVNALSLDQLLAYGFAKSKN